MMIAPWVQYEKAGYESLDRRSAVLLDPKSHGLADIMSLIDHLTSPYQLSTCIFIY